MGFQRVEIEPNNFSQDMPNIGEAPNRSFCITIVTSTSPVYEQTIRTSQRGKECLTTKLEPHVPICIPPFQLDRTNPEECNKTWNRNDTHSPIMGSPTMVPLTLSNGNKKPNPTATAAQSVDMSKGYGTSTSTKNDLETTSQGTVTKYRHIKISFQSYPQCKNSRHKQQLQYKQGKVFLQV